MDAKPLVLALAICAAAILAAAAPAGAADPWSDTASYLEPLITSPECTSDARRRSACRLVGRFFRAVNSREFGAACALLGRRLRSDWQGVSCEASLDGLIFTPRPWAILGARIAKNGVSVLLSVGQPELERFWMRKHRVYVAREEGRLRILQTRVVP